MPGLEDLDLRHHPVSEQRGWRKMWHALERAYHLPSVGQFGATRCAVLDVRQERSDAESGLAVQELIDFVW
ncbi:MAG TPA: hypothetical protein VFW03_03450 [Gemmatimonadaceae bacterium]|nr:hypothetical protein [Gemmatimonadaceae bacterium]